jgi:hypothetical protein
METAKPISDATIQQSIVLGSRLPAHPAKHAKCAHYFGSWCCLAGRSLWRFHERSISREPKAPSTLAIIPPPTFVDMAVCYRPVISHSRAPRLPTYCAVVIEAASFRCGSQHLSRHVRQAKSADPGRTWKTTRKAIDRVSKSEPHRASITQRDAPGSRT